MLFTLEDKHHPTDEPNRNVHSLHDPAGVHSSQRLTNKRKREVAWIDDRILEKPVLESSERGKRLATELTRRAARFGLPSPDLTPADEFPAQGPVVAVEQAPTVWGLHGIPSPPLSPVIGYGPVPPVLPVSEPNDHAKQMEVFAAVDTSGTLTNVAMASETLQGAGALDLQWTMGHATPPSHRVFALDSRTRSDTLLGSSRGTLQPITETIQGTAASCSSSRFPSTIADFSGDHRDLRTRVETATDENDSSARILEGMEELDCLLDDVRLGSSHHISTRTSNMAAGTEMSVGVDGD